MKISIIGAGRVGQTLGRLAREAGYEMGEVVCRSRRSARAAVRFIGAGDPQVAPNARLQQADLILISTPDGAITDAVEIIRDNARQVGRAVALHTSGALSSGVLSPLTEHGLAVASCHPLQTFESPSRAIALARASFFCIEGEPRAVRAARQFVRRIGARHFEIATCMKDLYHAAAVLASGGVVALLSISLDMLSRADLCEAEARKVLLPLVEGTIINLRAVGPARALTGPVRRGDVGTVERNMKAIAAIDPAWLEVYRRLAERGMALIERTGADKRALVKMRSLLKRWESDHR